MFGLGDIDPNQVVPAGLLTPTPDNPLGIPGLGGTLVVPQLPGFPGSPATPLLPPVPNPCANGGCTDPNAPHVGPLPGGAQPAPPAGALASITGSPLAMLAIGGLAVFLILKVLK